MDVEFSQRYVGQVVDGRYRIDAPLAQGGMGIVFRGHDLQANRTVAIKVLRYTLDSEVYVRFEREARVIASFDHPNLVKMYGSGMAGDLPYLALEFVEGISLGQVLIQGRLSVRATAQMGVAIASALQHAHEKGVIHRDLKPDNILIREIDGQYHAKLVDFGVAHAMSEQSSITRAGSICGTPGYVSPEQIKGHKVTPKSDLYSFGICLFESLTGTRAYPGTVPMQILLKQASSKVPSLTQFPALMVPTELHHLVSELLEVEPEQRPASAGAVAARLAKFADVGVPTDSTDQIQVPTDKFERVPSEEMSISIPIRVGGGWDELLAGSPETVGGVIDPQLFDVNPKEIDVSFEFTSMGKFTGATAPDTLPDSPPKWIAEPPAPIVQEDYSNVGLARPIRDIEKPGTVYERPTLGKSAPFIFVLVMVVIFSSVVAIFYWRGKVRSTTVPDDVLEESIRGEDVKEFGRDRRNNKKKIRKTPEEGTPENPIELFDD